MQLVHVTCGRTGVWMVVAEDDDRPLSEHASETDAERAALALAAALPDARVLVHDRYSRVHEVPATELRHPRFSA
jgi:Uncharacterized protein conserved in bacteria (DUF2188)